jgi:hypothetical protein
LTYDLMHLKAGTHLADAVDFFIYDTAKIFLLLVSVIYLVTLIRQAVHATARPQGSQRPARGDRQCDGGGPRSGDPVLLLFGLPAVHRLR